MVKSSAIEITFPPVCLSVCVCNACVLHINRGLLPESVYTTWYARAYKQREHFCNCFSQEGLLCRRVYEKLATFDQYLALSRKRYTIMAMVAVEDE